MTEITYDPKVAKTLDEMAELAENMSKLLMSEHMDIKDGAPILKNFTYISYWLMMERHQKGGRAYIHDSYVWMKRIEKAMTTEVPSEVVLWVKQIKMLEKTMTEVPPSVKSWLKEMRE